MKFARGTAMAGPDTNWRKLVFLHTLSKIALNLLHCQRSVLVHRLALEAGEPIRHPRRPVEVGAANDS
eukprot:1425160-Pyramimonas_sp.AAC.1